LVPHLLHIVCQASFYNPCCCWLGTNNVLRYNRPGNFWGIFPDCFQLARNATQTETHHAVQNGAAPHQG
jgi:hypothetical protein